MTSRYEKNILTLAAVELFRDVYFRFQLGGRRWQSLTVLFRSPKPCGDFNRCDFLEPGFPQILLQPFARFFGMVEVESHLLPNLVNPKIRLYGIISLPKHSMKSNFGVRLLASLRQPSSILGA